jgi:electron transfer flavoprotein alpha subunit
VADDSVLLLPASPDGRDLAPRLAHALDRPLFAGAIEVSDRRLSLSRWGGLAIEDVEPPQRFVATLVPGVRGVEARPTDEQLDDSLDVTTLDIERPDNIVDVEQLELLAPDAASVDLSEAERIVAGGAGLDGAGRFEQLAAVAAALGASMGATRVVTDKGWVGHERQIGTTGVVVDPVLYIALAISGAVQHTSGLGQPEHIVSVNVDGYCPMMQLADLAIVSDANAVLGELAARLLSAEVQHADA